MGLRKGKGFHPFSREQPFSLTQYVSDLPILHRAQAAARRPVFFAGVLFFVQTAQMNTAKFVKNPSFFLESFRI